MIISVKTQKEMYEYLLSMKRIEGKYIDSKDGLQEFLKSDIRFLAKKLFRDSELYIGKITLEMDEKYKLKRIKNYKCTSNRLIYDTLHAIKNGTDFTSPEIKEQILKVEKSIDAVENGSNDRKKLIKECKLYWDNKEIELLSSKDNATYNMAKESWLAEQVLGKYSIKELNKDFKVKSQAYFKESSPFAQVIKPDIIFIKLDAIIVVDCKVYSALGKYSHGKLKYISNANRYQVNSYIGKCLEQLDTNSNKEKVQCQGIILHIVNDELYNKYCEYNGCVLTIEESRPIKLYMIQDKGLDYILSEYRKIIENTVSQMEKTIKTM